MNFLMKACVLLTTLFCTIEANQQKLIINAQKFTADDATGITTFEGSVDMQRSSDRLRANKLVVYMTPSDQNENMKTSGDQNNTSTKREAKKFIATGNVDFEVHSQEKIYVGKGDKVIYDTQTLKYTIIGNGYLEEKVEGTKLYGEKIFLDEVSGKADIEGSENKPVKFIMNIESKK